MIRQTLAPTLALLLGALPAAAATVSASSEVTLTVLSATEGLVFDYAPFFQGFESAFGASTAATSSDVASGDLFSTTRAAASAVATPSGDAVALIDSFETAFVENASDAPGTLVLEVAYELSASAAADGPLEFALGSAAFEIFEVLPQTGKSVTILSLLVEDAPGGGFSGSPSGLPASLSGTEVLTFDFAPFAVREFDVAQDAFAFAVAAIPVPATGGLLLVALGAAAGLRRRR